MESSNIRNKLREIYAAIVKFLTAKHIRQSIISYLENIEDEEKNSILDYVMDHRELTYFNYGWFREYDSSVDYPIFHDEDGMSYVMYDGKKMYFRRDWGEGRIREYLDSLIPEQDPRSPHLYFAEGEMKEHYGTVIDGGVAEGFFSLTLIDRSEKLYLVECDEAWCEALERTFEPYKDKVTLIKKFLGDRDDERTCTVDSILEKDPDNSRDEADIIKLDIEGAEIDALNGGAYKGKELLICVYHHQNEEKEVKEFLERRPEKYEVVTRKGWIYFLNDIIQHAPYLRRGVLRAVRQ